LAQQRLYVAIDSLRKPHIRVDGDLGDPDPIQATDACLKHREFDEIVVSTLPPGCTRIFPHRIERKFHRRSFAGARAKHIGADCGFTCIPQRDQARTATPELSINAIGSSAPRPPAEMSGSP
jgi:hypothetical protein